MPQSPQRLREYQQSPEGKAAATRARSAWQKRNKDRRAAHVAVGNAVRDGVLVKPDVCSRCPNTVRIEAHHPDYAKPLEVVWLCVPCHKAEHKGKR